MTEPNYKKIAEKLYKLLKTEQVYCVFTEGTDYYARPQLHSVFRKEADALEFIKKLKEDDEKKEYKDYFQVFMEEFHLK